MMLMRRIALLGAIFLGLSGTAGAHGLAAGSVLQVARELETATCPSGVPVQVFTVVNQAHVRGRALASVEHAVVDQSLQLRDAWSTPCVQFRPGGWRLYLKIGGGAPHGEHDFYQEPYALVWTGGATTEAWSSVFSHEVVETLVDPTDGRMYAHQDAQGVWTDSQIEVADPVERLGYPLDGIYVSDFVTPNWFAGAGVGQATCAGIACEFSGSLLAAADAPGPYDEMGQLTAPWQAQWGDPY